MSFKVISTIVPHAPLNISLELQAYTTLHRKHQGMATAYGESIGCMTDDITWPRKVKLVTPIRLEPNGWI